MEYSVAIRAPESAVCRFKGLRIVRRFDLSLFVILVFLRRQYFFTFDQINGLSHIGFPTAPIPLPLRISRVFGSIGCRSEGERLSKLMGWVLSYERPVEAVPRFGVELQ